MAAAAPSHFGQLHPAVQPEVRCGLSVDPVGQIRAGDLDRAVVTRSMLSPDLRAWIVQSAAPPETSSQSASGGSPVVNHT